MSSYATVAQFDRWGLSPNSLPATVTVTDKEAAISAASAIADGYLGAAFRLPLSGWGDDLSQRVCEIAAYKLVSSQVGFNPELGHNHTLVLNHDSAVRWFEQVSRGHITPVNISETPPTTASVSRVLSNTKRGW